MKKTVRSKRRSANGLKAEYRFDYGKARPNRFAGRMDRSRIVILAPDVAKVFQTPESVNKALRALIDAMPKASA